MVDWMQAWPIALAALRASIVAFVGVLAVGAGCGWRAALAAILLEGTLRGARDAR